MKLVILDRDGVINHDRPDYVKSASECQLIAGSIEAIARLSQAGFMVVIATNQSGLARGLFDLDDLEAIHHKITDAVLEAGGSIDAIFYCPHHPDDECKCRKPNTGMLDAIEAEFNGSVSECYFVGDSLRDIQAGLKKGCKLILVKTGNGQKTLEQINAGHAFAVSRVLTLDDLIVVNDLAAAATEILCREEE
jgi:D-glycero-D-manno-heptose 1,7-bisphosphate phosphatase